MRIATKTALAFAAFAAVCVGGAGGLLLDESREALHDALIDRQRLLVANRALVLRENLGLAIGELERLADMAEIDLDDGDLGPEQRLLGHAYRQTSFFNGRLELYGLAGRCRWAEPVSGGCREPDSASRSWLIRAREAGQTTLLHVTDPDGRGLIDIVAPVRRGGRSVGVLRGVIDLQRDRMFSPPLAEDLHPTTRVALVTADGRPVIRSAEVSLNDAPWTTAVSAFEGGQGGATVADAPGGELLLAWTPVGRGDLWLLFAWPLEVLDDDAERHVRSLSVSILLVGLLALGVGFIVARGLTQPLKGLAEQVRGVHGDAPLVLPASSRPDEVGEVQRALCTLLARLEDRESHIRADRDRISDLASHLEDRVEERTRELRATRDALVEAERMAAIGRAATVLSHELRNALNAVSVAMDTLGSDTSEEALSDARRLVRSEVARLRTLSDDLLSYAKEPVIRRQPVSVAELLELVELLTEERAKRLGARVEIDADAAVVWLDPERMQTVLVNLVHNAVEATAQRDERVVRVTARAGDALAITVDDSGEGVAEAIRERVFQPFVTARIHGIGLGLAIAERFVLAHGGTIQLAQSPLGGARFVVCLPLEEAPGDEVET